MVDRSGRTNGSKARSKYRRFRDLIVYQLSYKLTLEIFEVTKQYPAEERSSLTDQIRRSSRSIPGNLAEAWKKRRYKKAFVSKLIDCSGESGETEVWLDMSRDCGYITEENHQYFLKKYEEVSRMLTSIINHPEKFSHEHFASPYSFLLTLYCLAN